LNLTNKFSRNKNKIKKRPILLIGDPSHGMDNDSTSNSWNEANMSFGTQNDTN
jgi:hypothetical protein